MVASRVAKHHEAAAQALQRKEYYPRARVFAEARQREEMKSAWEQREHAVCSALDVRPRASGHVSHETVPVAFVIFPGSQGEHAAAAPSDERTRRRAEFEARMLTHSSSSPKMMS